MSNFDFAPDKPRDPMDRFYYPTIGGPGDDADLALHFAGLADPALRDEALKLNGGAAMAALFCYRQAYELQFKAVLRQLAAKQDQTKSPMPKALAGHRLAPLVLLLDDLLPAAALRLSHTADIATSVPAPTLKGVALLTRLDPADGGFAFRYTQTTGGTRYVTHPILVTPDVGDQLHAGFWAFRQEVTEWVAGEWFRRTRSGPGTTDYRGVDLNGSS